MMIGCCDWLTHALALHFPQAQLEKEAEEDNQYRQQLEQERRDHELALRLAQESNSQVDDSPLLMRKYANHFYLITLLFKKFYFMGNGNDTKFKISLILHIFRKTHIENKRKKQSAIFGWAKTITIVTNSVEKHRFCCQLLLEIVK